MKCSSNSCMEELTSGFSLVSLWISMFEQTYLGNNFKGWYEDNWYEANLENENISCTKEEMRLAAEGHLTTEAVMWNQNNQTTISGMTSDRFK